MTPSEQKAQELIEKFKTRIYHHPFRQKDMIEGDCKACALICVQNTIEVILSIIGNQKHLWKEGEKDIYNFWQQVKTHLQ